MLHIELRRWADCLVIAPLSANTLAKCAQGLCDNLLTCVVSTVHMLFLLHNAPGPGPFKRKASLERLSRCRCLASSPLCRCMVTYAQTFATHLQHKQSFEKCILIQSALHGGYI